MKNVDSNSEFINYDAEKGTWEFNVDGY